MHVFHGIPASPGYAIGPVHIIRKARFVPRRRAVTAEEVPAEQARFRGGVSRAKAELSILVEKMESIPVYGFESD